MTAPSGGRDVLAERLAEAWHDDLTKNGLVCHHSMINGREDPPEAYIECLNVAEGMIAALGPDAGPMRRALGDGDGLLDLWDECLRLARTVPGRHLVVKWDPPEWDWVTRPGWFTAWSEQHPQEDRYASGHGATVTEALRALLAVLTAQADPEHAHEWRPDEHYGRMVEVCVCGEARALPGPDATGGA